MARLDLSDGALTSILDFEENPQPHVWARDGRLYWVTYAEGNRFWASYEIETAAQHRVRGADTVQAALGQARAALLDGGALLVSGGNELIWMSPTGNEIARLGLAGAAYTGTGIAVAVREGDELTIGEWPVGQPPVRTRVRMVDTSARLVDVDADGGHVYFAPKRGAVKQGG